MPDTADEYREHREELEAFRDAYEAYLDALRHRADPTELRTLRRQYNELLPGGETALAKAGRVPAIAPPPVIGGPYQHGLAACVHGIESWHGDPDWLFDVIDQAVADLRWAEKRTAGQSGAPRPWPPEQ
jgi:hypothetical protein